MDGARWVVGGIVVDGDGDGDDDVQVVDGGGWRWWCSRAPSRALYRTPTMVMVLFFNRILRHRWLQ